MGLKWFRARLRMDRAPKSTSSIPGFYRSMSQFDRDDHVQPSASRENRVEPGIHSVPAALEPTVLNPMAALNSREIEATTIRRDNGLKATRSNSEEEPESLDNGIEIPRHLPRESIEIMRSGSAEGSPSRLVAKSTKGGFKKKKARAPLPKTASDNSTEDNRRWVSGDKGRSSDGSEMEI